ncbi:MAG: hypothetical protein AB7O52_12590 [Planctomycetota bacterium]
MKSVRSDPFGEWNIVYFNPEQTDEAKILARLRAKGCPNAQRVPSVSVELGANLRAMVTNPVAVPGDVFVVELQGVSPESPLPRLVLPSSWTQQAAPKSDPAKVDGTVHTWLVRSHPETRRGRHEIRLVPAVSDTTERTLTVELVNQVR